MCELNYAANQTLLIIYILKLFLKYLIIYIFKHKIILFFLFREKINKKSLINSELIREFAKKLQGKKCDFWHIQSILEIDRQNYGRIYPDTLIMTLDDFFYSVLLKVVPFEIFLRIFGCLFV